MDKHGMYTYTIDGKMYRLAPDFNVSIRQIYIKGCGLHSMEGEYLGYWDRYNIPLNVLHSITAWTKQAYSMEIAARRMKLVKASMRLKSQG